MTLTGKTALVTGAARGIGAAIATRLASEGAAVAICDLDLGTAQELAAELSSNADTRVCALHVDVSSRASVVDVIDEAEASLGAVEVLVNNAGIDVIKPFVESTEDEWDRIIAVNLRGQINTCHVLFPRMSERGGGAIVNISSDAARVGSSGEAVYSAAKGGVIALTKTLAREGARSGIRVNCVCPGPTDTALLAQINDVNPKLYEALARSIPMRRVAQPEDIAPMVAFLASDDAGYITGQTISVSGGMSMA
jgi:2-hydroxycyclohexanecarboxyl-CoA dehydrogenase